MRTLALALFCLSAAAFADTTSEGTRNLELLERYGELGRRGDSAAQAAMWAPDAINNGRPMDNAEIRAQLEDLRRAFPDLASTTVETTVKDDLVIVLQRTSGTHRGRALTTVYGGMLRGVPPTNKRFEILRAHWWRFRDGKIVWHQVVSDDLSMLRQLGLIPDSLEQ
jgi:predicted ester cyclase